MKARINGENPPPDEADDFEHGEDDDAEALGAGDAA